MAKVLSSPILQLIRGVAIGQRLRDLSDSDLLRRFVETQDQEAFDALVRRHGAMVLDVCRGVLGNEADAEDAFQATFLILARKASSVRKEASVGSWFHGVAYRTGLKAKAQSATRKKNESRAGAQQAGETDDLSWREVRAVLHEELSALAERYRGPLVTCYLEGITQDEAAAQLGIATSTLKDRLERGRELLRARLVRRGLGPAAALIAAAWPLSEAAACLPAQLVLITCKSAGLFAAGEAAPTALISEGVAALAKGVLKTMFVTKIKSAIVSCTLASLIFFSTGFLIHGVGATAHYEAVSERVEEMPAKGDAAKLKKGTEQAKNEAPEQPFSNEVLNAGLNPKDPRILALVAYLDKNGMKLVLNSDHYWHITKPAAPGAPDGAFAVSIRTFPDDASEKQMHMALFPTRTNLARISLPYKLNAPARIAMSYVSGHGPTKATKEDFAAVEAKLAHLFMAYRPVPPKDAEKGPKSVDSSLKLKVIGPIKRGAGGEDFKLEHVAAGEDITLEVILSTDGDKSHTFRFGSFPQVFGIYIVGPSGNIAPDRTKIRPENWMQEREGSAEDVTVSKGSPYRATVKLSEYFRVTDANQFKEGVYQVNVKFFAERLRMAAPIDSGPLRFELADKKKLPPPKDP